MVDPNTRSGKRTPVTLKIKFKSETLEQFIERYAVDVSQGGIFIRTKEPLAVGTQMRFEFQLRDASSLIGGEGTVVWTRENDPSRPSIAPGMGVRFDRLAEGSQAVLERILSEKAKQAPARQGESTKQPLFTDAPTRVAPAAIQDQLLGSEKPRRRGEDSYNDQHTPLPKPMPFHSDADEFPEEAFEEATKVRALDELVAQTADPKAAEPLAPIAAAPIAAVPPAIPAPPPGISAPSGLSAPPAIPAAASGPLLVSSASSSSSSGSLAPSWLTPAVTAAPSAPLANRSAFTDLDSAPGLPSPPETRPSGSRLLDTTPSPRTETAPDLDGKPASSTRLGVEPARVPLSTPVNPTPAPSGPHAKPAIPPVPAATGPSGPSMGSVSLKDRVLAVPAEPTVPVRSDRGGGSSAGIAILILVVLAAGAAGAWFFFLRDKAVEEATPTPVAGSGSSEATSQGSGSQQAETPGSAAAEPPKAATVDTVIEASVAKAKIEVVGTDQSGPAPLTAKLEKDKQYRARVEAPGYATNEIDIVGGAPAKVTLDAKPRVIAVTTEPAGAAITIDGVAAGKTPQEITLTKAQAAKKTLRVGISRRGFKPVVKIVAVDGYTEDPARMLSKLDVKLATAPVATEPVTDPVDGPEPTTGTDGGEGSAATPPTPPASGSNKGSAEPEPDFNKTP